MVCAGRTGPNFSPPSLALWYRLTMRSIQSVCHVEVRSYLGRPIVREVYPGLFLGNLSDCRSWLPLSKYPYPMIHAAKSPCHTKAVGKRQLPKEDPDYLFTVRGSHQEHLILNMIDPDKPLFQIPMFSRALDFLDKWHLVEGGVVVHCNKGESRAPSLAMLWMAKRAGAISDDTFATAHREYLRSDPAYKPGAGLVEFLTEHWNEIT